MIWRAAASCRSRRSPDTIDGKKVPRSGSLPRRAALFSHSRGLWTNGTSVRKAKQGEIPADIFALLTCEPNAEVGRVLAKAKAVILTTTAVARCCDDCGQVRGFLQRGQRESGTTTVALGDTKRARDQLRGSAGRLAKPGEPGKLEPDPAGSSSATSLSAFSTSSDRVRGSPIRRKARISLSPSRSLCAEDTLSFIFELPDFM